MNSSNGTLYSSTFDAFLPWHPDLVTAAVFLLVILGLMVVLLFLTSYLGEKNPTGVQLSPYECGNIPVSSARFPYPAPFYLMALFFLVFDVEAAFIFSWAIAFDRLGWKGWFQISFFILILLASLVYLWLKGALEWSTSQRTQP